MKYFAPALALVVALCATTAHSQTFTSLLSFSGTGGAASGANPFGSLTFSGTTLYGMTSAGGVSGEGNVFSVGTNGANYQNLVSFTGNSGTANGLAPYGSLTLGGTTLYGMTTYGGDGNGNVFSVGSNGANYQNLVSLTATAGSAGAINPYGSLTLSGGTALYGMASAGGFFGRGDIISLTTDGSHSSTLQFNTSTFNAPYGNLTVTNTAWYGMTSQGGNGIGNVFRVSLPSGSYQNLVSFTGTGGMASGASPFGSLTPSGSTLYGMTSAGGASGDGNVFSVGTDGTSYRNLLSFSGTGGTASGLSPQGSLVLSGTTLYGMTQDGGAHGDGNIFSVGIDGTGYQNLYGFTGGADGSAPFGDLMLTSGTLFGMTSSGGANNDGTVFGVALPAPTPEPATLALVGTAAVAAVSYRWRRRRPRRPQQPGLR